MTIAVVGGQGGGAIANSATVAERAFGSNVSAGSLIVVVGLRYSSSSDAWVAGDCTLKAGSTATIGTIALDVGINNQDGATANYAVCAIWSAIVTGTGSCTMEIAGASAASYILCATQEFTGSWDASRLETSNSNSGDTDGDTAADSGSVTSAGAALMVAGFQANGVSAATITDDAAFTSIYKNQTGTDDNGSAIYRIVSSGTTDTANWTVSGTTLSAWACAIAVYKEAAGGGGISTAWLRA